VKETADLCTRKAHYAAERLTQVPGIRLRFGRPFSKEFTLQVEEGVPAFLAGLLEKGYHAGLHLGRWYPSLDKCFSVTVTEKRTRAEIDGLVSAFVNQRNGARNGVAAPQAVSGRVEQDIHG
jgi:glycine dehydrogenase subunit 1